MDLSKEDDFKIPKILCNGSRLKLILRKKIKPQAAELERYEKILG